MIDIFMSEKTDHLKEVPLAGYTDRLSARPGDTVKYHLSSTNPVKVKARLTHSICADPNPKGLGIVERDASEHFEERTISIQHQTIPRGSYAQTRSNLRLPSSALKKVTIQVWFYPTLLTANYTLPTQNVWSWGSGLSLDLTPLGQLEVSYSPTRRHEMKIKYFEELKEKRWYCVAVTLGPTEDGNSASCSLSYKKKGDKGEVSCSCAIPRNGLNMDAPFILATEGTLNGRLENPEIKIETEKDGEVVFAAWDTSCYHKPEGVMDPWTIPCSSGMLGMWSEGNALVLKNHPTRGVKGRHWDGTEFSWTNCPKHYGAIHFHDNDVYDFEWKPDMEWKVPQGIPSGIYMMRFTATGDSKLEEALPIFICAPKNEESDNKLVLLIPTFTYVMYGNHARPDFEKDMWLTRTKKCNGYPYNPVLYPAYGHSSYDFHSDQTGIAFASHLRPLFNLRPGYVTFSRVGGYNDGDEETQKNADSAFCSGLRHFPADSHIVSWLHHYGFHFDIITDHELHREGAACLEQYSTLLTCTHPEYHTPQSLGALQDFRDVQGGNLVYLGGNGFYWKIGASTESPGKSETTDDTLSTCKLLEIRRCEGGVRTWAAEAGEYYNLLDGNYGGLWRNSGRPPSKLAGIGFAAQGSFVGKPFQRTCHDRPGITDWVFDGISEKDQAVLGNYGFSGDGAAGYELDRIDRDDELYRDGEIVILAQADTNQDSRYALVPEEVLTPWTNLAGTTNEEAKRADMVYFRVPQSGAQVFSVGSITFCGCLPYNGFKNPISRLIRNVVEKFLHSED
eukprot:CAMPEP_0116132272 /NCGR_PEP_ID=MMETSP0329-20121206/9458_1 /TAXON_ID=697910 /ORGANISM="Pseudo-nitzschia arenysensis, Strain B593" /LENGTH=788 /DNA_ID=CAMNT_0003626773 /DNA_START=54 /DNA_END=2420 /DNA_ORIENTATION=-